MRKCIVSFLTAWLIVVGLFVNAAIFFLGMAIVVMWLDKKIHGYSLHRWLNSNAKLEDIDRMTGAEFELYLQRLLNAHGWCLNVTKASGDMGADLFGITPARETVIIQAKRYSKNVGVHAIQEAAGARGYYAVHRAVVVTNSNFTPAAKHLADRLGIELWGRPMLQTWIYAETRKKAT